MATITTTGPGFNRITALALANGWTVDRDEDNNLLHFGRDRQTITVCYARSTSAILDAYLDDADGHRSTVIHARDAGKVDRLVELLG